MKTIQRLLLQPWLYLTIVIIGISLKFYHIERKFFWYDEIETIMHTSGIADRNYYQLIPVNEIRNISYYHDLLHLNTQDYTIKSQLTGLFSMPQLAPLHHALLIFWHRIVGDDYVHYRLFNVFIFILTLPFIFLLCKTLFQSNLAGWIAVSLFSISPYYNIFTQEARYYILWTFFLILLNYLFLICIKKKQIKWWIAYSIIGILAMYTSLLSIIMVFGHLLFIWFVRKEFRLTYVINLVIISLGYLPWIIVMFHYQKNIIGSTNWMMNPEKTHFWIPLIGQGLGFPHLFAYLEDNVFYFLWYFWKIPSTNELILPFIVSVIILVFIITSIIYVLRKIPKETKYYLAFIILPGILFFFIHDIIRTSLTSYTWRYHTLTFIGILLIIASYLSFKISKGKLLFSFFYLALIGISLISILKITSKRCHLDMSDCQQCIDAAHSFSNANHPLLITDYTSFGGIGKFFELIAECDSENIDILRVWEDIDYAVELIGEKKYSEIYIVHASDKLIHDLLSQFGERMKLIVSDNLITIWQIKND